ncbi:hypothetical protein [Pseudomonas poae]|uniref:Uncharacterized protein n=1 Tax=Pseudomonas poae TaxID=200451 RepID=A0A2S9EP91_9PSED|nr:hypothetical protein [Pseudomonas poae]PRA26367.1 hypothetical protein CQZ97_20840 [Pseudomonas poae]PRC17287.1 hypothetical protein CQZ99_15195 [Pseudomonas poae]
MIGDERLLPKLYRQMASAEKRFDEISTAARDAEDSEERAMLFQQMIETKSSLVSDMALSSTYQTYVQETLKFALTNSA